MKRKIKRGKPRHYHLSEEDLVAYETNYDPRSWMAKQEMPGWVVLPEGILWAVEALIKEVRCLMTKRSMNGKN